MGLPVHCQVWSWLTQAVGGAEPQPRGFQTVGAPGWGRGRARAGRDLTASSCFLWDCKKYSLGSGWYPAHHTHSDGMNERCHGWVPDWRALNHKLKSPCSGVAWKVLKPAVM